MSGIRLSKADKLVLNAREKAKKKDWVRYCHDCGSEDILVQPSGTHGGTAYFECNKCHSTNIFEKAVKKRVWIKFCPHCKSDDVVLDARWLNSFTYRCRKCGHISQPFPEKVMK